MCQAIEEQTAPDYAPTLGAIAEEPQAVAARLDMIDAAPSTRLTLATITQQVREEVERLAETRAKQAQAAREGVETGHETLAQVAYLERRAQLDRGMFWALAAGWH